MVICTIKLQRCSAGQTLWWVGMWQVPGASWRWSGAQVFNGWFLEKFHYYHSCIL